MIALSVVAWAVVLCSACLGAGFGSWAVGRWILWYPRTRQEIGPPPDFVARYVPVPRRWYQVLLTSGFGWDDVVHGVGAAVGFALGMSVPLFT